MDVQQLLARFDEGVCYACGCEEKGLHPAVVKAVIAGTVPVNELMRCPLHAAPLLENGRPIAAGGAS